MRHNKYKPEQLFLLFIGLVLSLGCKYDLSYGLVEIATEIIGDTLFERGFALTPLDPAIVQQGGGFEKTYLDTLDFGNDGSSPVWMLAQWHSRYDLADTPPADGLDARIEYANEGKKIALCSDHSLWLEVDASQEYDSARVSGQPWPHLLIAQNFNETVPNIGAANRLDYFQWPLNSRNVRTVWKEGVIMYPFIQPNPHSTLCW